MNATDEQWSAWKAHAARIGAEHGANAATWINMNTDAATEIIAGVDENINPEVVDRYIPNPPTGEWGDDYSPAALLAEIGAPVDGDSDDGELWSAYADAFTETTVADIVRCAHEYLSE